MNTIRSLQLIALKDILVEQSEDSKWRQICRWYSKTFATPLHVVEDLPRLDILQHYIEENYENLEEAELQLELDRILSKDDMSVALEKAKEDSKLDELEKQIKEEKTQKKQEVKKELDVKKLEQLSQAESELLESFDGLGQILTDIKKTVDEPSSFDLDFLEPEGKL